MKSTYLILIIIILVMVMVIFMASSSHFANNSSVTVLDDEIVFIPENLQIIKDKVYDEKRKVVLNNTSQYSIKPSTYVAKLGDLAVTLHLLNDITPGSEVDIELELKGSFNLEVEDIKVLFEKVVL